MIDPRWQVTNLEDFYGAWTALDECDVPLGRGFVSQNCDFIRGRVQTRLGFGTAYAAAEQALSMFNWQSSLGNYLVWFLPGTGARAINVASSPSKATIAAIATAGVTGASFAPSGPRLYVAPYNTSGAAVGAGYVVSYSSGFASDALFSPPITYTPSAPTEPGAGVITLGSHRIGYIIETRSGYIGRPSPDSGSGTPAVQTFTPVTFTAAGAKNLSIVLNPTTWPTDAKKVHIIMTPVYNPNLYFFVPGANATVTGGASDSKTITWSISDEDLAATGAEATGHLFFMSQTTAGAAPFNPKAVLPYGDRLVYLTTTTDTNANTISCAYISNRNNYQQLAADRSLVLLPGQLDITSAFTMGGTLYLLGPNYTYYTHDTTADPVEWPLPTLVDGRRGTLAPKGVTVSPTGKYAFIANTEGLWLFDGTSYSSLPISYYNNDVWQTINWAYPSYVQVLDDPGVKKVYVMVPLDAATTPSHILCFDYTNGMTADKVSYSSWVVGGSYAVGSMALVQNDLAGAVRPKHAELWLSSSGAASILRQVSSADTTPYRDVAAGIATIYETGPLPGESNLTLMQHHGGFIEVTGAGTLAISVKHKDNSWTETLSSITLAAAPGVSYLRQMYRIGERSKWRFTTSAADSHFELSALKTYTSPYQLQR